jgi:hypothetical protein
MACVAQTLQFCGFWCSLSSDGAAIWPFYIAPGDSLPGAMPDSMAIRRWLARELSLCVRSTFRQARRVGLLTCSVEDSQVAGSAALTGLP